MQIHRHCEGEREKVYVQNSFVEIALVTSLVLALAWQQLVCIMLSHIRF